MKRLLIILFLVMFSSQLLAPDYPVLYIERSVPVDLYAEIFDAICFVESSYREKVVNVKEQAYGLVQIRQSRLTDFNRMTGKNYTLSDCLRHDVAKEVFYYYAMQFDPSELEEISKDWNRSKTDKYWNRVKNRLLITSGKNVL